MSQSASQKDAAAGKENLKDRLKTDGRHLAGEARASAARLAGNQRDAVSGYLSDLAMAAAAGGENLDASGHPRSAAVVVRTAGEVDNFARRLEDRAPSEIWGDVEDFARAHPALVFGAGFALAFGVTRFLKSSAPEVGGEREDAAEWHQAEPLQSSG